MFWRGTWTSSMALVFWLGVLLFIGGCLAFFNVAFLNRGMSDPMITLAIYAIGGQFLARFGAGFLDILMTAFGRPLFYDLQITDDLNINQA